MSWQNIGLLIMVFLALQGILRLVDGWRGR
jgi:hypothetical protein